MNNDTLQEILKSRLDEIRTNTLEQLISQDTDYKHACKMQSEAENEYINLNLSSEHKSVIDNLLHWNDTSNMEYGSLCYLAGLYDSSKLSGLSKEPLFMSSKGQVIRDFYRGKSIPAEKPYESQTTLEIWHILGELEDSFRQVLSQDQLNTFNIICSKNLEWLSASVEDSFTFGFRKGAELLIDTLC